MNWPREEANKCYTALQQIQDNDRLIAALTQYILTRKIKEKQRINSEHNWVVTYCPSSGKQENVGWVLNVGTVMCERRQDPPYVASVYIMWCLLWLVRFRHKGLVDWCGIGLGPKYIIMKKNIEY